MPKVFKKADYGDENCPFIQAMKVEEVSDTDSDDDEELTPTRQVLPKSYESYQQEKRIAHAMIDIAMISANVNRLRYVLDMSTSHPYYHFSVISISVSICVQFLVAVGMILNIQEKISYKHRRLHNLALVGTVLITIINVFIPSFSTEVPSTKSSLTFVNLH